MRFASVAHINNSAKRCKIPLNFEQVTRKVVASGFLFDATQHILHAITAQ